MASAADIWWVAEPVRSDASPYLDTTQAAAHLGVTERFMRRLVVERRVRFFKVGKFVRFRAGDLDDFARAVDPVRSPLERVRIR